MDVSNQEMEKQEADGQILLDQVVSLTGLPEHLVHQELEKILELGKDPESPAVETSSLTLDHLRQAMLAYLETLHADMVGEEAAHLESDH
jgi:hypothetical protein